MVRGGGGGVGGGGGGGGRRGGDRASGSAAMVSALAKLRSAALVAKGLFVFNILQPCTSKLNT